MTTNQIALQLYTVREHTAKDMAATLRQVAEMGYQAVEFAGYGSLSSAQQVRPLLAEYGLQAASAHISIADFQQKTAQTFADLHMLGTEYAVVPWLPQELRGSVATAHQIAGWLNEIGRQCQAEGIQLAYHNHAFEFDSLENTTLWQVLAENTDPELVKFEFDVYWGRYAGQDSIAMLKNNPGRLALLHIKDMTEENGERRDAPVGEGTIDWQEVLAAGRANGTRWYIVEQDHPRDALNDVQRSLINLQRLLGQQTEAAV